MCFSTPVPSTGISESRAFKWEQIRFDESFPKLADYVSSYRENDSGAFYNWNDMTIGETEYMVQKIVDSFQGEYQLHCELRENDFFWILKGDIGDKFWNILVTLYRTKGQDLDNFAHYVSVRIS